VPVADEAGVVVGHVGIFLRNGIWNSRPVKPGGIGSVAVREDRRRQGVTSAAMRRATQELRDVHAVDFGLLFCEQRLALLYEGLGWRRFIGEVFVVQPPRGHIRLAHSLRCDRTVRS
jgi:GNAT superfamily N-acetyltransferase